MRCLFSAGRLGYSPRVVGPRIWAYVALAHFPEGLGGLNIALATKTFARSLPFLPKAT